MNIKTLQQAILQGKIFIYPTDTVYGIGCDALNKDAVEKIRQIKKRDQKPFSVIAPSVEWIKENCIVDYDLKKYLPGAYTLILKKKNKSFLNWVSSAETLGVRMPNHSFAEKIQKINIPFITTSVNFSGEKPASDIKEVPQEILKAVDIIIDGGKLKRRPSTLIINGKEILR